MNEVLNIIAKLLVRSAVFGGAGVGIGYAIWGTHKCPEEKEVKLPEVLDNPIKYEAPEIKEDTTKEDVLSKLEESQTTIAKFVTRTKELEDSLRQLESSTRGSTINQLRNKVTALENDKKRLMESDRKSFIYSMRNSCILSTLDKMNKPTGALGSYASWERMTRKDIEHCEKDFPL